MTATGIHDLGLSEVARIHGEMKTIMAKVGFKGTLQQFFVHLRTSPQYFHKTRDAYLAEVDAHVKAMEARLPAFFNTLPKARSEEHTSELQSLMRISYAVFCLKKKKQTIHTQPTQHNT